MDINYPVNNNMEIDALYIYTFSHYVHKYLLTPTLYVELLLGIEKKYPTFLLYFSLWPSYILSIIFIFFFISFPPLEYRLFKSDYIICCQHPTFTLCYRLTCVSQKKVSWSPKASYLRMYPSLEIGSLPRWSSKNKVIRVSHNPVMTSFLTKRGEFGHR